MDEPVAFGALPGGDLVGLDCLVKELVARAA
jgi:hypothetical protein